MAKGVRSPKILDADKPSGGGGTGEEAGGGKPGPGCTSETETRRDSGWTQEPSEKQTKQEGAGEMEAVRVSPGVRLCNGPREPGSGVVATLGSTELSVGTPAGTAE